MRNTVEDPGKHGLLELTEMRRSREVREAVVADEISGRVPRHLPVQQRPEAPQHGFDSRQPLADVDDVLLQVVRHHLALMLNGMLMRQHPGICGGATDDAKHAHTQHG